MNSLRSTSVTTLIFSLLLSIPAKAVDDETAAARFNKLNLNQKFTSLNNQKKNTGSEKDAVEKWIKKYNTSCERFQRNINSYNLHLARGSTVGEDGSLQSVCESNRTRINDLKDLILGPESPKGRSGGLSDQRRAAIVAKNKALKARNRYSPAVVARRLKAIDKLNLNSLGVVDEQLQKLFVLIEGDGENVEGLRNEILRLGEEALALLDEKVALEQNPACIDESANVFGQCAQRIDAINVRLQFLGLDDNGDFIIGGLLDTKVLDLIDAEAAYFFLRAYRSGCGIVLGPDGNFVFDENGLPVFVLDCNASNVFVPTAAMFKAQYKAAIQNDANTRLALAQSDLTAKTQALRIITKSLRQAQADLRKARAARRRLVRLGKCRETYEIDNTACATPVKQLPYGSGGGLSSP